MLDQAQAYLSRVVPWVEGAFVNIHWTSAKLNPNNGKPYWQGRAHSTLDETLKTLKWAVGKPDIRDIYVCMSAQATCEDKVAAGGRFSYRKAIKGTHTAVGLKSLFLDLDVKPDELDKAYASTKDAITALRDFIQATGLPQPTMAVASGTGGVHVYWCVSRTMGREEWQPMAQALVEATRRHGLKCDTQCTIDAARVLRVPGTLNWKKGDPLPVTLGVKSVQPGDYAVEDLQAALAPFMGAQVLAFTGATPGMAPRAAQMPGLNDEFTAGIAEAIARPPVDLDSVADTCGFVRDALVSGGSSLSNPLWNLTTLLATFGMGGDGKDGRAQAHRMAMGHPGYTHASTDELYDRKLREKQERNIGWPSCSTIQGSGCTNCATCPMAAMGKSPLNYGKQTVATVQAAAAMGVSPAGVVIAPGFPGAPALKVDDVPDGYTRNARNLVFKIVVDENGTAEQRLVLPYSLHTGWLQDDPWTLHFSTRLGNSQKDTQISILQEHLQGRDFAKYLGRQGVAVQKSHSALLQEYLLAWITKLQSMAEGVVSSAPFGWVTVGNKLDGFAYAGRVWTPTGDKPASAPNPQTEVQYRPRGDLQPWIDAAAYINGQKRPALDTIIASAFGAPLMKFCNEAGVILSAYSTESGIGKSTALKVAQSVWGNPQTAMQMLSDTENSVLKKVGELRSLPLFWDEIKGDEQTSKFVNLAFQLSSGKEKSRLSADAGYRAMGSWQTMLVSASNDSLIDPIVRQTKTTTAGIYRVLEFRVPPAALNVDAHGVVARLVGKTQDNFGQAGLAFAKFLGANHERVTREVAELQDKLTAKLKATPDERFWIAGLTCCVLGARYANELGLTQFDVAGLLQFLTGTMTAMRENRSAQPVDMRSPEAISTVLQQFLAAQQGRHTLVTDRMHVGAGRPPAGSIKVLSDPARLDGIHVQIGVSNKLMRISNTVFRDWLAHKGYSPHLVVEALKGQFSARRTTAILGSGSVLAQMRQDVIEVDLGGQTLVDLHEFDGTAPAAAVTP
ncbi:DUF927 domain-containing protein [Methylobacterium sp. 285MFTsu5.1]|uniref:DUF927 domain-containing protein n=1 Tax=Methylobacterium sp. 285MFTsu5.1 TaxID=1172187 RepID=UPI00036E2392|nr:DUF927 domain-containing protein [Methylobacterium sp. 285MFTsu5.1]